MTTEAKTEIAAHAGPWTEREYLALTGSPNRIELFDWSLYISPGPTLRHQMVSANLHTVLRDVAPDVGLLTLTNVNVRLRPGRLTIADLVISKPVDMDEPVIDAVNVQLVCEIMSPRNASTDRVLKMHYYAAAGIQWYLLIEQDTAAMHLYRLVDGGYQEYAIARPGQTLTLTDPVTALIEPGALLPPTS